MRNRSSVITAAMRSIRSSLRRFRFSISSQTASNSVPNSSAVAISAPCHLLGLNPCLVVGTGLAQLVFARSEAERADTGRWIVVAQIGQLVPVHLRFTCGDFFIGRRRRAD